MRQAQIRVTDRAKKRKRKKRIEGGKARLREAETERDQGLVEGVNL